MKKDGRVAQAVEHLTFNQVVRGSNPRTLSESSDFTVETVGPVLFYISVFIKFYDYIKAAIILFDILYNSMIAF